MGPVFVPGQDQVRHRHTKKFRDKILLYVSKIRRLSATKSYLRSLAPVDHTRGRGEWKMAGGHGEGINYKGLIVHKPKRWHTVTGKGLCAVMWLVVILHFSPYKASINRFFSCHFLICFMIIYTKIMGFSCFWFEVRRKLTAGVRCNLCFHVLGLVQG